MVEHTLRTIDPNMAIEQVRATKGKYTRAEPIAALYEQRRVTHLRRFNELHEQMTTFEPGVADSPDRLDAMVWALTYLSQNIKPNPKVWRV